MPEPIEIPDGPTDDDDDDRLRLLSLYYPEAHHSDVVATRFYVHPSVSKTDLFDRLHRWALDWNAELLASPPPLDPTADHDASLRRARREERRVVDVIRARAAWYRDSDAQTDVAFLLDVIDRLTEED